MFTAKALASASTEFPIVTGKAAKPFGFTLIELLVVLTIIGSLLTIVAPRFLGQIDHAQESVLRENLYALRSTIDKYYSDKGAYPATLEVLVQERYLRQIPVDPMTGRSDSWKIITSPEQSLPGVVDVRSGASGNAVDGSQYGDW